jgi:hypothetical protein
VEERALREGGGGGGGIFLKKYIAVHVFFLIKVCRRGRMLGKYFWKGTLHTFICGLLVIYAYTCSTLINGQWQQGNFLL